MTTIPLDVQVNAAHTEALADLASIADRVRYACQNGPGPRTDEVRQWLAAYGYETKRPYVSTLVTGYRASRGMDDTGDLPTLTDEVLNDLDRATAAGARGAEPAPVADAPAVPTDDAPALPSPEPVTTDAVDPVPTLAESVVTEESTYATAEVRTRVLDLTPATPEASLSPVPAVTVPTPGPAPAPVVPTQVSRSRATSTGMAILLTIVGILLAGVIIAPIALSSQDIIDWAGSPVGLGLDGVWPLVTFFALDAAAAVCVGLVVYCAWRGESAGVFAWLVWAFAGMSAYANYSHSVNSPAHDAVWFFPAMSLAGPFLLEVIVRRVRRWVQEGTGQRSAARVSFGFARWIPGIGATRETYGAWRLARLDDIKDARQAVTTYRQLCPTGSVRVLAALRKRDQANQS